MEYLREEDLFPGSMVKIYLNGKLEGYASLIEKAGDKMTYMENPEEEGDIIYGKCRWLIEWVDPKDNFVIDSSQIMTQKILAGKRTHRYIRFIIGEMTWETYAKENGWLKQRIFKKRLEDMDDENMIF